MTKAEEEFKVRSTLPYSGPNLNIYAILILKICLVAFEQRGYNLWIDIHSYRQKEL